MDSSYILNCLAVTFLECIFNLLGKKTKFFGFGEDMTRFRVNKRKKVNVNACNFILMYLACSVSSYQNILTCQHAFCSAL